MSRSIQRRQFFTNIASAALLSACSTRPSSDTPDAVRGTAVEAEVPDTLDLAERATLAVNALTGAADCEKGYCETIQTSHPDHNPAYMNLRWNGPCLQKPVHALPLMRFMSGSQQNADMDERMIRVITEAIDDDGLWWLETEGRPWRTETFKEDQCWPVAQGRLIVALLDWRKIDGKSEWLELAEKLSRGLSKIALGNAERAWYYTAYLRSGWQEHPDAHAGTQLDSNTSQEPARPPAYDIGLPLRGLIRWYEQSGDAKALDVSDRLANFMMKSSMWGSPGPEMLVPSEHARWQGHFHTRTMGMMGLLEYGIIRQDASVLRFVQQFYEYSRGFGISRMGFFPAVLRPVKDASGADRGTNRRQPQVSEGCAVADMLWLAATLSQAGVGDYWEDVDQYVRNHLVEHQMIDADLLKEVSEAGPKHKIDPSMETDTQVIERNVGAFASGSDPTLLYGWWTACCLGNCSVALHKAWESAVEKSGDAVRVNLLLNRASPWLDVDSFLPYEGKVVLRNRSAGQVLLRVPLGTSRESLRSTVNGKDHEKQFLGNYLVIAGLAAGDTVTVDFPLKETTETYTLPTYAEKYTLRMRGNTVVDISPRPGPALDQMGSDDGKTFEIKKAYPIYLRDRYKKSEAPLKMVQRYVPNEV